MSRNINRIAAEQDIRAMNVAAASQSGDAYRDAIQRYSREIGDVSKSHEPESEPEGMEQIKTLMQSLKR